MKNHQIKGKKLLTTFGFFSLILASNISEIKARYVLNNKGFKKEFIREDKFDYSQNL